VKAEKHELAFQIYYSLGESRTCKQVADLMGLKEKTIQTWSSTYKWSARIEKELKEKSEEIKRKREELESLGFEVAIAALNKLKEQIDSGKGLSKEKAQMFEIYLSCPLSLIGNAESGQMQSAGDVNSGNGKEKIEIIFDINGGVGSED
jgi:hypothetical protein